VGDVRQGAAAVPAGRITRSCYVEPEGNHEIHAADLLERQECYRESIELAHQLHSAGKYLAAAPLHLTPTASSVRVRDGKRLVTDGPFAETREQLGGYFLIEAQDLDEAIDVASQIPMARQGTVEVRPVIEIPGLPK
jgi:hypothetical protein